MDIGRFGIKRAIVEAVTSDEAERVTPHMSAIYLGLVTAPLQWWSEEKVLSIKAESRDSVLTPAWSVLVAYLRVPPETARQALAWLENKGFISVKSSTDGREIRISFEGLYFSEGKSEG
ncbi:MAG TPA: hypothetical protein VE732_03635 [Nitrososphaera sp.]|jgi:hypothetical protein|nr:hypothetical protein [Nitrososphaera sp.]